MTIEQLRNDLSIAWAERDAERYLSLSQQLAAMTSDSSERDDADRMLGIFFHQQCHDFDRALPYLQKAANSEILEVQVAALEYLGLAYYLERGKDIEYLKNSCKAFSEIVKRCRGTKTAARAEAMIVRNNGLLKGKGTGA